METDTQQEKSTSFKDKLRNILIFYGDLTIRGLVSLVVIAFFMAIISVAFHIKSLIIKFVLAFMVSIVLSPLYGRIRLMEKIVDKYDNYLNNLFKAEDSKS